MEPIITAKNISKKYTLSHQKGGYTALRDILANLIKNPFNYFKSKITHASSTKTKEIFWALQDINFTIEKGEVVGIIGHNGAGKSTLLKILSHITPPSEGEITIHGRVGSLLEVGTGFHPELTGRENIFLNGVILGMKKKEIEAKFDEIVTFAGVEKFLDTPVKYYSSGMYVRLAFSVAAHMEPDILIIDEVLAVGDAEFQKKCLGKMDSITKKDGRTILFVSHNMSAIQQLCTKTILLEGGKIKQYGPTASVIESYLREGIAAEEQTRYKSISFPMDDTERVSVTGMELLPQKSMHGAALPIDEPFTIALHYTILEPLESIFMTLILFNQDGQRCIDVMEVDSNPHAIDMRTPGDYTAHITMPGILNAGIYEAMIVVERGQETLDKKSGLLIKIVDANSRIYPIQGRASVIPTVSWKVI